MNKKIDINKLEIKIPFSVPSGYFEDLKFEIQKINNERRKRVNVFIFLKFIFLFLLLGFYCFLLFSLIM